MAVLSFKVQADYEKVVRLREEIVKLENQLKSFGRNTPLDEIKAVEARLSEAKSQFTALSTEAAKAGATIDSDFKAKIYSASQTVNDFTREIIDQKAVIRGHESDVKRLKEAYQKALKNDSSKASAIKEELDAAKHTTEESKEVLFDLTQQQAKAKLSVKELKDEYAAFKGETQKTTDSHEDLLASLKKMAGSVIGVAALKGLASQIVAVRGQFQDMETSIETLVGKDMTAKLMPQIKEMAKISPLTMTDIVGAEKMMLGFNIEADKTIDYLKALSDVSMGNSQKFNSLTLAFSQMSAAGKLMGQDLNQMINAGFNPLQVIAQKTGKSIAQLKEEMSKGAVSAEMVQQAFIDATSAGGKFYNMSENASKTINGQISMMQDAMDAAFNEIGTKTEGIIINSIKAATSLIQNYEKIGKVLVGLVTTYGAYRTAVYLATMATSKHTLAEIALTNVRIAARKAQMALNAAMLTNPYVALATVVAGLTAAIVLNADSMSASAQAHKQYNERLEEANRIEEDRKNKVTENLNIARDDAEATGQRVEALAYLKSQYPSIFEKYDLEKLKLADIVDLKREIAELDRQAATVSKKERLEELDKEVEKAAARVNTHGGGLLGKLASSANKKGYEDLVSKRDDLREEIIGDAIADYIAKLPEEQKELETLKNAFQQRIDNSESFILEGFALTESHLKRINEAIAQKIAVPKYSVDYEAAKKKYEEDYAAFKWAEENKTKVTTKEYQKRKAAMEASEKEFKKLGGDPNEIKKENEKAGQQERLDSMTEKNAKENARAAKDMEFKVWQSRIDAMKDGYAKTMAQKALDHQKELDSLERQKQDYIEKIVAQEKAIFDAQEDQKAKNDKKYKKRTFDADAVRIRVTSTDEVIKQYAKLGEDAAAAYSKAVEDAIREQDFTERQQMIDSMSDGSSKKRAQRLLDNERELYNLEQQREAYIEAAKAAHILAEKKKMAADPTYMMKMFDESQANADYDVIVENTKRKQYDELADEYMSYIDKKNAIDEEYEADKLELEAAYAATGDEKYKRSLEERTKANVKALNALEGEYNTEDYQLVFGDPSKMTSSTIEKALGTARKWLAQLNKEADPETFQALTEAIDRLEDARDSNPFEGWGTSLMDVLRSLKQIKNIRKDIEQYEKDNNLKALEAAKSDEEKAKKALREALIGTGASEFASSLTQAAEAMKEIAEAAGDVQLAGMADQLGAWAQNLTAAAQGAASGGWIGAIVGGVSDIISQTVQFFVSSKASIEKTSKEVEEFRRQIELLKYVVDEADFSNIFGIDELAMSKDALDKAKIALADYESMMAELNSNTMTTLYENEEKFHSLGAAIMLGSWGSLRKVASNEVKGALEAYEKGYSQLEAMQVKTKDVNGWGNFWGFQDEYTALKDLAPELWGEDGVFDVEAAKLFLETNTQLNDEQRAQIQNVIDLKEAYDEANAAIEDYLEDLFGSWAEDLGSIISDSILEGVDAWEEFGKKGSEVIKQLGQQAVYTVFFKDTMDAFSEQLKNAVGNPDEMARQTAALMEALKGNFDAAQAWLKDYYDMAEGLDFDMYGDSGYNQSASRRGYETLSEDTGNELVGRAIAQYESNLRMEEATRSMKASVDIMAANQVQIRDIAAESRAIIADSFLELQQIRENTGAIIKPIQNLSDKIDGWDSYIKSL